MHQSPVPGPSRNHDVSELTTAQLEQTRRDPQTSLALARPGSAASVPILAHLSAVDTELAGRSAGYGPSSKPSSPGIQPSADTAELSTLFSEIR